MLKHGLCVLLALFLFTVSCITNTDRVQVPLGERVSLVVGDTIAIKGENLEITFEDVPEDSRCAKDVVCVWEGRVRVLLDVTQNGLSEDLQLIAPGLTDQYVIQMYKDYQFSFGVAPYPESTTEIALSDYRLLLTVTRNE